MYKQLLQKDVQNFKILLTGKLSWVVFFDSYSFLTAAQARDPVFDSQQPPASHLNHRRGGHQSLMVVSAPTKFYARGQCPHKVLCKGSCPHKIIQRQAFVVVHLVKRSRTWLLWAHTGQQENWASVCVFRSWFGLWQYWWARTEAPGTADNLTQSMLSTVK